MTPVVLGVSGGLLLTAVVFYVLAWRACSRALAALAEARQIHAGVDDLLKKNLDTISQVEEFTVWRRTSRERARSRTTPSRS